MELSKVEKAFTIFLILLFAITPFMVSWNATYQKDDYTYKISLSPIYYIVHEKNGYGYNNYSYIHFISNLKPSELYVNSTPNLQLLVLVGIFYFTLSMAMVVLIIDGFRNKYVKEIDFAMSVSIILAIIYYYMLRIFLENIGYSLYGSKSNWHWNLGIGFYLIIIMGVTYLVSRKIYVMD